MKKGFQDIIEGSLYYEHINNGFPTILFDSGLGDDVSSWDGIFLKIAERTSTLRYDRAGIGKSPASSFERTAERVSEELHTLLKNLKIAPPYLLVGHSLGGWHMRVFAGMFPNEIAGLLLIDPQEVKYYEEWKRLYPKHYEKDYQGWVDYFSTASPTAIAEWTVLKNRIGGPHPPRLQLPNVPTIILTCTQEVSVPNEEDYNRHIRKLKFELTTEWLDCLSNATNIQKPDVGHYIHKEDPALIIRLLDYLLDLIRK